MRKFYLLCFLCFWVYEVQAQVPTITGFSPGSGIAGTTVTITGTNFNAVASNNSVFFGAVAAPVITASPTQLTVNVPTNATLKPITVINTANGLQAASATSFKKIFNNSTQQVISNSSFAAPVSLTTAAGPFGVVAGDLDDDGKIDLISSGTSTLSVFRNTSTIGSLSFAAKVDVITGVSNGTFPEVADLDGDGKLDVLFATNNANFSLRRNTSPSAGTISFGALQPFSIPTVGVMIKIKDLDKDGKPDIVCTSSSTTSYAFRNTSVVGTINFSSSIALPAGSTGQGIEIADLNGDGLDDLIIGISPSGGGGFLRILKNNSSPGNISFTTATTVATAGSPVNGYYLIPTSIDLNNDGKPDIVSNNTDLNTLSSFLNTSSGGNISFGSNTDYTAGVQPFSVMTGDLDGDGKIDIMSPDFGESKISVFQNVGTVSPKVDFATGANPVLNGVCDLDGDGKPELVVTNIGSNSLSVLRNTIASILPITLTSFTASTHEKAVSLRWETSSEQDNNGFEVLRNSGTGKWETVGFVRSKGNSSTLQTYNFEDQPTGGNTFLYQLRQIDVNGKSSYTNVLQVKLELSKLGLTNYPNPFKEQTTINYSLPVAENVSVVVRDQSGKLLKTISKAKQAAGNYAISFYTGSLPAGQYYCELSAGSSKRSIKLSIIK